MRLTTNYLLKKPEGTDSVKLQDFNDNADALDAELALQQIAIDAANTHSKIAHVTGIKGSSETTYRTGQVNITKDNIGLSNVPNVATNDQTPTYTEATVLSELTSGEKLSVALGKIKLAVKNVKTLLQMLGNTDISGVGNGTVTGALAAMNSNFTPQYIPAELIISNNGSLIGGAMKLGKLLFINITITNSVSVDGDAWVGIASIKPGFRPSYDVSLNVIGISTGDPLANYIDYLGGFYVSPHEKSNIAFFISGVLILA